MKISRAQLQKIVKEEMSKMGMLGTAIQEDKTELRSTEDAAKDAEEIDPGEEGRVKDKELDMLKALKIKESKLLKQLGEVKFSIANFAKK